MALVKGGKIWHAHFFVVVDDQRFRQSLDDGSDRDEMLLASVKLQRLAEDRYYPGG
jgi:hypothetical protein